MNYYDYKKAKELIEVEKDELVSASLGMAEDWFWTATEVFADGEFKVDLDKPGLTIAGIDGSYWATPCLELCYIDGKSKKVNVTKEG